MPQTSLLMFAAVVKSARLRFFLPLVNELEEQRYFRLAVPAANGAAQDVKPGNADKYAEIAAGNKCGEAPEAAGERCGKLEQPFDSPVFVLIPQPGDHPPLFLGEFHELPLRRVHEAARTASTSTNLPE